ncbi:MAG TPA: type II secretion system protein [Verrucomicrobiae bacterium]
MRWNPKRRRGFSLIELMVVIAIVLILAGMLLPALTKGKMKAKQTECTSHLRQSGLAFRMFADDHDNRLPMQVSVKRGGTMEYANKGETWRHFQVMSNLLVDPKLLVCPADKSRSITNWSKLGNANTSYFVGLDAKIGSAHQMLAGDRNILTPGYQTPGVVPVRPEMQIFWTEEMHQFRGNILFGDGHVQAMDSEGLQRVVTQHAMK